MSEKTSEIIVITIWLLIIAACGFMYFKYNIPFFLFMCGLMLGGFIDICLEIRARLKESKREQCGTKAYSRY